VTAQIKKVIVHADLVDAQHVCPYLFQPFLDSTRRRFHIQLTTWAVLCRVRAARRLSILPFAVSGNTANSTNVDGTM